jgi:glycosyltransferase involved in cell wall biosynthesis
MNQPLVSLLIANFNNGKYIEETLHSAVNQSYPNIEIVIIDDASADNSLEIIDNFINKNPQANIKLSKNEVNSGGCGCIKRQCIALSSGEYFAFLDPEDTIELTAVEQLMAVHLQNQNNSIVYCTHWLCNEKLEPQSITTWAGKIPEGQSHLTSTGGHISAFAINKRSDYDKTDGINPKYIVAEDMDLYLKMEEIAPVFYVDKPLYYYRKHDNNSSWSYEKRYINLFWRHAAETAAYNRRKNTKTAAKNLKLSELHKKNFAYFMQMAKFNRIQKKYFKAIGYNLRAMKYFYTLC